MHVLGEHRGSCSQLEELGSSVCRLPSVHIPLGEGTEHERKSLDVMSDRNEIRKLVLLALPRLLEEAGREAAADACLLTSRARLLLALPNHDAR